MSFLGILHMISEGVLLLVDKDNMILVSLQQHFN